MSRLVNVAFIALSLVVLTSCFGDEGWCVDCGPYDDWGWVDGDGSMGLDGFDGDIGGGLDNATGSSRASVIQDLINNFKAKYTPAGCVVATSVGESGAAITFTQCKAPNTIRTLSGKILIDITSVGDQVGYITSGFYVTDKSRVKLTKIGTLGTNGQHTVSFSGTVSSLKNGAEETLNGGYTVTKVAETPGCRVTNALWTGTAVTKPSHTWTSIVDNVTKCSDTCPKGQISRIEGDISAPSKTVTMIMDGTTKAQIMDGAKASGTKDLDCVAQ